MFAHVFHMRQGNVLSDNEWTGWLRWMKSAFEGGTITEIWQSTIEMEKWFDPAFQEFVDKELIPLTPKNKIGYLSEHSLPPASKAYLYAIQLGDDFRIRK